MELLLSHTHRIFWALAFTGSVIIAAWMISAVWQKYTRYPVIVSFQSFETKTNEIAFPAITICNMNKILRSKAEAFMRYVSAFCNYYGKIVEKRQFQAAKKMVEPSTLVAQLSK